MPPPPVQSARCQTIPLPSIILQNDDFRITTREDVADLASSIKRVGLLNPPLLVKQKTGYTVVSGFRRIEACRKTGWNEIAARILDSHHKHLEYLMMAIADNAIQRPLNLIETSRALKKLEFLVDNPQQLAKAASTCGLPSSYAIISKVKDLCLLPSAIQYCILNDIISLSMANELANMDPDTAVVYADIFNQLKLSLNKQKEIVTLVSEIARRQDVSTRQVLSRVSLQSILNDEDLDRGQKGRRIRSCLRQWRFPRIVEAERYFNSHLKKLKLGHDIKLIPPKEFEGTVFTLNINFKSKAQLKITQSILDRAIQNPSFDKIIEGKSRRTKTSNK